MSPRAGRLRAAAGLLALVLATTAYAHGVDLRPGSAQALVVRAAYSDGTPMRFAKVRVVNSQGKTHQVGNADASGRFAWLPDREGEWRAIIDDGIGHRAEVVVEAGAPAPSAARAPGGPPSQAPLARALWGLSAIFWLTGALFWWRGRRSRPVP